MMIRRSPRRSRLQRAIGAAADLHRGSSTGAGAITLSAVALVVLRRFRKTRALRGEYRAVREREAAKSDLLKLASHEIRTPLTVVRGYLDLVVTGSLGEIPAAVSDALLTAQAKLREVDEVAGQMTEAARMDSGTGQLRLELIDVGQVAGEARDRMQSLLRSGQRLVLELPDQPVRTQADRFRLRVVLVNLIGNAIKYSPEGGEIRCAVDGGAEEVRVVVADQGIGIAPSQLTEVFQPFRRLATGDRPSTPGLGLGLHVAREIARAHGGDLTAAGNPGGGTAFELTLPRALSG